MLPPEQFREVILRLPARVNMIAITIACLARLVLCFHDGVLIVLHGFIKKTQKTPADDLSLARRRMAEVAK